ncbi:MAG: nuclear transport factor 2 family protein [Pseudomonadota bacterium]
MAADEDIRSVRQLSNDALEQGDLSIFMASIDGDYVGTAGNGGHIRTRGELRKLARNIFSAPTKPYFLRATESVTVAEGCTRAVELGRWTGYERLSGGDTRVVDQGHYTAYWKLAGGRWMIHAELFVTLT